MPGKTWSAPPAMQIDTNKNYFVTMETSEGAVKIEMLPKEAPNTVNNFIFLARQGFYNDTKFHRIIKGFMIQGGDPTGTGSGGPGYRFADELPKTFDYKPGILAMANAGANTQGSQFFIMHGDLSNRMPKNYTIFGRVADGMDTIEKIANTPVTARGGEMSLPQKDVKITGMAVIEE